MPPPGFVSVQPSEDHRPLPPAGPRHKLIAGAVALVVAVVAAFLLFGSTGASPGGPIAQAAIVSSSTAGYKMQMSAEMTLAGMSSPITASGSGTVDLRDNASSMSLSMNFGDQPQLIEHLGSSSMQMNMVLERGSMYVKFPSALSSLLPTGGRQWMRLDMAKLASLPGLSSLGSNPTMTDPTRILQYLRSVSDGVVNEGPEQVDGITTNHYQAQLSFARVLGKLPETSSAMQQAIARFAQALPSEVPVDVWIDAHHLVRRVRMALALSAPSGPAMQESVTLDITDYGPQPLPATPRADQVFDMSGLQGAAG